MTGILLFFGLILIDIGLIFLGRKIYKNYKLKGDGIFEKLILFKILNKISFIVGNIYFLAFVIKFIPILSHLGSMFMGFNNINIKKIIKIYLAGYIFFVLIGYYFLK